MEFGALYHCYCFCATLVLTLNLTVCIPIPSAILQSSFVYKTGSLDYTVVTSDEACATKKESLWIVCSSVSTGQHSYMALSKDGEILAETSTNGPGKISVFSSRACNEEILEGNYSCYQNISYEIDNGATFSYEMSQRFAVQERRTVLCETSVGDAGILQEWVKLICVGDGNGWRFGQSTLNTFSHTMSQTIGERQDEPLSCGKATSGPARVWREECTTVGVNASQLTVEISPKTFTNHSNVLRFECRSDPPRLMHWAVHSSNGNIVDPTYLNQSIKSDTYVHIDQAIGLTTIDITEGVAGSNGIHTVSCFTYDTQVAIATANLVPPPSMGNEGIGSHNGTYDTDEEKQLQQQENIVYIPLIAVVAVLSFIIVMLLLFKLCNLFISGWKMSTDKPSCDVNKTIDVVTVSDDVVIASDLQTYNIVYQSTELENNIYDSIDQAD